MSLCAEDVVLGVLTDPPILLSIVQWQSGWPWLVKLRWQEAVRQNPAWHFTQQHFIRHLLITGDAPTLRAGTRAQLDWFYTTCVLDALQSGCPKTLQWAFENSSEKPHYGHAWAMALRYFKGNTSTLNVLKRFTPWTEDIRREIRLYTAPVLLTTQGGAPRLIEWIVLNLGSSLLPPELLNVAVEARHLALVDGLLSIDYSLRGNSERQVLLPSTLYRIYALANVLSDEEQEEKVEWVKLLQTLLQRAEYLHDTLLEGAAWELDDVETLKLLEETRGIQIGRNECGNASSVRTSMIKACQIGTWEIVQDQLKRQSELPSVWVLNYAARAGRLEIVKMAVEVLPLRTVDAAFFIAERFQQDHIVNYLHEVLYRRFR